MTHHLLLLLLHSRRFLGGINSSTDPVDGDSIDSDFVVILAALLCALICVLGLVAVARCAWIRRISGGRSVPPPHQAAAAAANTGLKKKILRSLPKLTYSDSSEEASSKFSDCPICLTEFNAGDEIRVLPQCGHGFHVLCIDTWLGSHSSCPSCRQIPVVVDAPPPPPAPARCQKCGDMPATSLTTTTEQHREEEEEEEEEEEQHISRFLP